MRRGTLFGVLAGAAAAALIITVSVVWPGLDAKQTPPVDTAVWALQTGAGSRYARVNTVSGELDTVRSVSNPTAVAESAEGSYLFTESFGRITRLDEAMPADLDETALKDSPTTPAGTVEVVVAGGYVAYRTDSGAVFAGPLAGEPIQLDPFGSSADDDTPQYSAAAISLDEDGVLHSFSPRDGEVLRYRIPGAQVLGTDPVSAQPDGEVDIVSAGDDWFVVDLAAEQVWRAGDDEPVRLELTGTVALGRSSSAADGLYLADETGLVRVDDAGAVRVVGGQAQEYGMPARPTVFAGAVHAAWLRSDGGVLWRSDSDAGEIALDFGGATLGDQRRPVFTATDAAMILNETRSGWVWTLPDGALVASSQNWSLDERVDEQSAPSDEQARFVPDPKPPVAEDDRFGVRAGTLASLPVLLNDHDPNTDVLTIDPASVTGLDPSFGVVSIIDSGQRLAVRVDPAASGTASFRYRVTDGTAPDGLYSETATVTLTVVGDTNSAPVFCGVDECLATWPTPEVEPGGTVSVPALNGWVDPEGDPLLLLSVTGRGGVGSVASTPAGDIVYQHPDAGADQAQVVELEVTVADTRGAVTTRDLMVRVNSRPTLVAESFAVTESLASGTITVDVTPHVTGTVGRLSLTAARVLDEAPAEAQPSAGGAAFDFTAEQPGTYLVSYTVTAGGEPATGLVRLTIVAPDAPADLATAPVIAFVRAQEDATLDVFEAVANPTRRVLLLSEVRPHPDAGATMTVDAVGQRYIRVAGSTATGEPGRLGTVRYTVSDGTDDAGARVEGEATVYLLPPAPELAPIAVDDAVVVRAGAQLDIPVLDNDVAPSGGAVVLDPASVQSPEGAGLAFASGGVLRYLAPSEPGEFRISYAITASGAPLQADTAEVRVKVIDDESNRAPRPETLEGRVLAGASTTIAFDAFAVDPDGDQVVLDRILTQPEAGSATLSADGRAIVYTSVPGDSGQRSFTYRVVDAAGATGTGTVRVGVLDAEANPSPVTFTDYVQVQAGARSSIRVSPLANDVDPTGGRLSLTAVRPDLPETLADGSRSPEFVRQSALIAATDPSTVTVRAGLAPGTMSYLYDVVSDSGNTARGLIVVKVVRDAVPSYPVVTDTVLTAETRDRFRTGVDVVSGMVMWPGGDVGDLTVSLWGAPPDVRVTGTRLSGPLPEQTRIVPFAVSGTTTSGEEVTSYGFLRVPGDDDLTLALRTGVQPQEVSERDEVAWDMRALVATAPGATLEVGEDAAASGARPEAVCTRTGATTVRYTAGGGAPWSDACIVPVRLAGQSEWTYLSVPVRVRALDPQPELHPASLTVGPGETAQFDLKTMTSWQYRSDWAGVAYALEHGGSSFDVALAADGIVRITGHDTAVPGAEDVARITITSHPGVAPARLILRVGAAPRTLPRGGTAAVQCSQAAGTSCTIDVVGAPGEVNPLPGTPLELREVRPTGECPGVTFARASATTVVASWTADAPGATCTAAFTLRDAQNRITAADREGRLLLDLHGYPQAPAAVRQAVYDDGEVTLRVDAGQARAAYPALTGFVVRHGGEIVARCAADGACPVIPAPNGEPREYEVRAVNAVGESRAAVRTIAWAYDPPPAPESVTAEPVVTGGDGGVVALTISGIDTTAVGELEIRSATGETRTVGVNPFRTEVTVPRYQLGANTTTAITVTPFSRFAMPPGFDDATSGSAVVVHANGIGAPREASLQLTATADGDGTATISASGRAQVNGEGSHLRYGIVRSGDRCEVAATGGDTATFAGLPDGVEYAFDLCVESWYAGELFGRTVVTQTVRAVQSPAAPTGFSFVVAPAPEYSADRLSAAWIIRDLPTSAATPPRENVPRFTGIDAAATPMSSVFGRDPGIRVAYEHREWGTRTQDAAVGPRSGSAPYQVRAAWRAAACVGGDDLSLVGESTRSPQGAQAAISFDTSRVVYRDASGAVLRTPEAGTVPVGAVSASGIRVTVDWSALEWGLDSATEEFSAVCEPNLPPDDEGSEQG